MVRYFARTAITFWSTRNTQFWENFKIQSNAHFLVAGNVPQRHRASNSAIDDEDGEVSQKILPVDGECTDYAGAHI